MHCPKVDRTQQLHLSLFGVRRHPRVQTTMTYKGWVGAGLQYYSFLP